MSTTVAQALAGTSLEVDNVQARERSSQKVAGSDAQRLDRGYHAFRGEAYSLPNDDVEHARLDMQDHTWKLCLHGGLHLSPVSPDIEHVVDIGTGTGGWAVDFARAHPTCNVLGTDLSPVHDTTTNTKSEEPPLPSNVNFALANANEDWDFQGQKQDFIHSRMLTLGIRDWKHYFAQAFHHTKPGGWVEVQETRFPVDYFYQNSDSNTEFKSDARPDSDLNYSGINNSTDGGAPATVAAAAKQTMTEGTDLSPSSPPLYIFSKGVFEAANKLGVNLQACDTIEEIMRAQGFINIRAERVNWAVGTWPKQALDKEIGKLTAINVKNFFVPALAPKMLGDVLGWDDDRVQRLMRDCVLDIDRGSPAFSDTNTNSNTITADSAPEVDPGLDADPTTATTTIATGVDTDRPYYSWRFYLFSGQKPF